MAKSNEQLLEENKALREQVAELTEQLKVAEATKPRDAKPVIKIGNRHYEVVSGIRTNAAVLTPQQLAADIARCTTLVEQKSGLLREIKIE
jgi:cell division septum initiation protein DivIVA